MDDSGRGRRRFNPAIRTPGQGIWAPVTRMSVQSHDVEGNNRSSGDDVGAAANGQLLGAISSIFWYHQHRRKESQCFMLRFCNY